MSDDSSSCEDGFVYGAVDKEKKIWGKHDHYHHHKEQTGAKWCKIHGLWQLCDH